MRVFRKKNPQWNNPHITIMCDTAFGKQLGLFMLLWCWLVPGLNWQPSHESIDPTFRRHNEHGEMFRLCST